MKLKYMLFIIPAVILSCTWDNEEALYPENGNKCDSTGISYYTDIVPILSTNCYMCHSDENSAAFGSNIGLEQYADVKNMSEIIKGAINHNPLYSPMPKNNPKLDSCLILQFEAWLNLGAPEN